MRHVLYDLLIWLQQNKEWHWYAPGLPAMIEFSENPNPDLDHDISAADSKLICDLRTELVERHEITPLASPGDHIWDAIYHIRRYITAGCIPDHFDRKEVSAALEQLSKPKDKTSVVMNVSNITNMYIPQNAVDVDVQNLKCLNADIEKRSATNYGDNVIVTFQDPVWHFYGKPYPLVGKEAQPACTGILRSLIDSSGEYISAKDLAQKHNCSISTVKSNISRIHNFIDSALDGHVQQGHNIITPNTGSVRKAYVKGNLLLRSGKGEHVKYCLNITGNMKDGYTLGKSHID